MLGPVVCRACGAKVREDRARCLRCGAPLAAAQDPAATGSPAVSRPLWAVAAAAVVAVGGVAIVLSGPPMEPVTPAVPAAVATAAAPVVVADEPIVASAPAAIAASMDASRGAIAAYSRGDITGSIEQFSAAVDADPQNADALNNLGQVLVRDGRARDAIPYFDRAIAASGSVWAYHFNRARAYAVLKEWGRAIPGYREAARLFPDDYVTAYNLARALQESGELDEAIAGYERAIALAPGEPDFHLAHANALERAQRPADAVAAYRRYLELQEEAPQAEKIKARIAELEKAPPAP